nr:hypothetical protein [Tanacetum cinerariifolium]
MRPDEADWAMVGAYFVQLILQDSIPVWFANGTRYKFAWRSNMMAVIWNPSIRKSTGIFVPYFISQLEAEKVTFGFGVCPGQAVLGGFINWVGVEKFTASDGSYTKIYVLVSFNLSTYQFQVSDIPEELRDVLPSPFHISQLVEVDDLGYQLAHKLQVYDLISEEFQNVGRSLSEEGHRSDNLQHNLQECSGCSKEGRGIWGLWYMVLTLPAIITLSAAVTPNKQ